MKSRLILKTTITEREYADLITPEASTNMGYWGPAEFCPDRSFAKGFSLKVLKSVCTTLFSLLKDKIGA